MNFEKVFNSISQSFLDHKVVKFYFYAKWRSQQYYLLQTFDKRASNDPDKEVPSSKEFSNTLYESEYSGKGIIYGLGRFQLRGES